MSSWLFVSCMTLKWTSKLNWTPTSMNHINLGKHVPFFVLLHETSNHNIGISLVPSELTHVFIHGWVAHPLAESEHSSKINCELISLHSIQTPLLADAVFFSWCATISTCNSGILKIVQTTHLDALHQYRCTVDSWRIQCPKPPSKSLSSKTLKEIIFFFSRGTCWTSPKVLTMHPGLDIRYRLSYRVCCLLSRQNHYQSFYMHLTKRDGVTYGTTRIQDHSMISNWENYVGITVRVTQDSS